MPVQPHGEGFQPVVALEKSVKSCQIFRQGWSRYLAFLTGCADRMWLKRLRTRCVAVFPAFRLLVLALIRPEPVQIPSGVCQG